MPDGFANLVRRRFDKILTAKSYAAVVTWDDGDSWRYDGFCRGWGETQRGCRSIRSIFDRPRPRIGPQPLETP
jgi:hypothetical protein